MSAQSLPRNAAARARGASRRCDASRRRRYATPPIAQDREPLEAERRPRAVSTQPLEAPRRSPARTVTPAFTLKPRPPRSHGLSRRPASALDRAVPAPVVGEAQERAAEERQLHAGFERRQLGRLVERSSRAARRRDRGAGASASCAWRRARRRRRSPRGEGARCS